ncbi:cupin domain-containing protein [Paenarthrobacter nitroguajacolicus]|uniref:cupin domain-containing protein n=1 Tax=Paenarthrobacter nitroguajacolicus TaxID=211146 RepID=UPI003422C1F2
MSAVATTIGAAQWPMPNPVSPERVISGQPATSTLVLNDSVRAQSGLWKVSPGEFTTKLTGYQEFIHIVDGQGKLVRDDGETIILQPGVVVSLPEGWAGRWLIEATLVKVYTMVRSG